MKIFCPSCDAKINIGAASRYHVFTCTCGRQFRGIYANLVKLDFLVKKFLLFRNYTDGYDAPNYTPCPFCGAVITLAENTKYAGFISPYTCWSCCHDLPTERVKQFVQK